MTVNVGPPRLTARCLECGCRTTLEHFGLVAHMTPDNRPCGSRRHQPGSIWVKPS